MFARGTKTIAERIGIAVFAPCLQVLCARHCKDGSQTSFIHNKLASFSDLNGLLQRMIAIVSLLDYCISINHHKNFLLLICGRHRLSEFMGVHLGTIRSLSDSMPRNDLFASRNTATNEFTTIEKTVLLRRLKASPNGTVRL